MIPQPEYWGWWRHIAITGKLFIVVLAVVSGVVLLRAVGSLVAVREYTRTTWTTLLDRSVVFEKLESSASGIASLIQTVFFLFVAVLFSLCIDAARAISISYDLRTDVLITEAARDISVFAEISAVTILFLHLIALFVQARIRAARVRASADAYRAK
jgi:hypothetical protein